MGADLILFVLPYLLDNFVSRICLLKTGAAAFVSKRNWWSSNFVKVHEILYLFNESIWIQLKMNVDQLLGVFIWLFSNIQANSAGIFYTHFIILTILSFTSINLHATYWPIQDSTQTLCAITFIFKFYVSLFTELHPINFIFYYYMLNQHNPEAAKANQFCWYLIPSLFRHLIRTLTLSFNISNILLQRCHEI